MTNRIVTPPQVILRESLMFGVMVGAIATVGIAVLTDWTFLNGLLAGAVLAAVVTFVVYTVGSEPPPPRGPGNAPRPDGTHGAGSTPGVSPAASTVTSAGEAGATAASAMGGAAEAAPTPAGTKPELLAAARGGQPDDLQQIRGVGPKLETALNEIGVYHYDQIASWSADEVAWMDENLVQFKGRVSRDEWVAQARDLVKG